jgi:hypothetical protein
MHGGCGVSVMVDDGLQESQKKKKEALYATTHCHKLLVQPGHALRLGCRRMVWCWLGAVVGLRQVALLQLHPVLTNHCAGP